MTEEKAARRKIERYFLVDSEELFDRLQPYYDLIDAAKKSVYGKFITSTDMSPKSLKECIIEEAKALDTINSNVCIGVSKNDVTSSLKPLYRKYKRSVRKNSDKPPFYHVNILRQTEDFAQRFVSFAPPLLRFDNHSNMCICNDRIPMHGIVQTIRQIEETFSCKLSRITFKEVGAAVYNEREHDFVTYVELTFEVDDESD